MLTKPIYDFKPLLKSLYQDLYFEAENFYLTLIVYEIPQKIVSPKMLKLKKIVALPFEDLRYLKPSCMATNRSLKVTLRNVISMTGQIMA